MKKVKCLFWLVFFMGVMGLAACGSSSTTSSSDDNGGGGGGGTTVGDTVLVSDLETLPDLDISSTDLSANVAAKAVATKAVGDVSPPGCMAITFFKPLALANMKLAEQYKCNIKTTQRHAGTNADGSKVLSIPQDSYAYYAITRTGSRYMRVRVGNFVTNDANTFKMAICKSADGTTYQQNVDLSLTGSVTEKKWSGTAKSHMSFPADQQPQTPMGGAITSEFDSTTFNIVMSSATALESTFSFDSVASATTTGFQVRNPTPVSSGFDVQSDTNADDVFRLEFGYDGSTNTTSGSFRNAAGTAYGIIYAQFNATHGAGLAYNFTPRGEETTYASTPQPFNPLVSPATQVASSGTIDLTGMTLDAGDTVTLAEALAGVQYSNAWNCEPESGASFTSIDATGFDFTACDALGEEAGTELGRSDNRSCWPGGNQ